jgi:hypothetical protein
MLAATSRSYREKVSTGMWVIGRDSRLHVLTPTEWYWFAVPDAWRV